MRGDDASQRTPLRLSRSNARRTTWLCPTGGSRESRSSLLPKKADDCPAPIPNSACHPVSGPVIIKRSCFRMEPPGEVTRNFVYPSLRCPYGTNHVSALSQSCEATRNCWSRNPKCCCKVGCTVISTPYQMNHIIQALLDFYGSPVHPFHPRSRSVPTPISVTDRVVYPRSESQAPAYSPSLTVA